MEQIVGDFQAQIAGDLQAEVRQSSAQMLGEDFLLQVGLDDLMGPFQLRFFESHRQMLHEAITPSPQPQSRSTHFQMADFW